MYRPVIFMLLLFIFQPGGVKGQTDFLKKLSASPALPDTEKVDQVNDYAWSLARNQPDSAEFYAREAIRMSGEIGGHPRGLINANIILGILNKDRGFFETSVTHYLAAMELAEKTGDSLRLSGCLNNLGAVYQEQGNLPKALEYFQRSLEIEDKLGRDKSQRSIRLYNIGETYAKMDSLDEAYAFYYQSFSLEEELNNEEGILYARMGIGNLDLKNGNLTKAKEELDKANSLAIKIGSQPAICEILVSLGRLEGKSENYSGAEAYFQEAIGLARKFRYKKLKISAFEALSGVLRTQGRYREAISAIDSFYASKSDINNAVVNSRIEELNARYELSKKEFEIGNLRMKDELKEKELTYQKRMRNLLLLTVAVIAVLILLNLRKSTGT